MAQKSTKLLQWMSNGKFSVFTLSYVNTARNQSAFRIVKCYIINIPYKTKAAVLYQHMKIEAEAEIFRC